MDVLKSAAQNVQEVRWKPLSKKCYAELKTVQPDVQQLNVGYFGSAWQKQNTSHSWKNGHLFPEMSSLGDHNKMYSTLEGYQYNVQNDWDSKEDLHDHLTSLPSGLVPSFQNKLGNSSNEVCLVLTVPPENRFRYRYDTEMSITHGTLQGVRTEKKKSVPTVELINYPFEALIRVSLVTCKDRCEHYPHPHSLFVKEKLYQKKIYTNWDNKKLTKTGHYSDPHYIKVGLAKNDYTARFEGMCIINSKKENFHSSVKEKMLMRCLEKNVICGDDSLHSEGAEGLAGSVEAAVGAVDVDFVSLCFEAFREESGKLVPICEPVYSDPVGNAKSAKTGKLKISRINKCSGSCLGGDEIWLLVEKINKKGLVIRFSELSNGKIVWESCIEGDGLILHHQYAIIFKTPTYRDVNIASEVEVLMRLERTTQPNQPCDYSEPITFVYEPLKSKSSKGDNLFRKESILAPLKQSQTKRPRTECSGAAFGCHGKRRTDDSDFEAMSFEDSDGDIEQLLLDTKDSFELDQTWGKFNVEEFLKFISSEDVDMPVQKDGISHNSKFRRDFLYKLYMLYSKLDESDIKKLTEQISNFRVSKKETADSKNVMEKDQVKDAASTLLSLRSKAMVNGGGSSSSSSSSSPIVTPQEGNPNDMTTDGLLQRATVEGSSDESSKPDVKEKIGPLPSVIKPNLSKLKPKEEKAKRSWHTVERKGFLVNDEEMADIEQPFIVAKDKVLNSKEKLDVEALRNVLDTINEKKAVEILDKILAKRKDNFG